MPWKLELETPNAVEDQPAFNISFFPNPGENQLFIDGLERSSSWRVHVNTISGFTISVDYTWINKSQIRINTESLKKGLYFIDLTDRAQNHYVDKFLIIK